MLTNFRTRFQREQKRQKRLASPSRVPSGPHYHPGYEQRVRINRHPAYGKRADSIKPRYQWNGQSWVTCAAFVTVGWHSEPDLSIRERVKLLKRNHHTVIAELADGRQVKRHIAKHRVVFELVRA
jgi:hypothetical protein